ncbi:MHJ_0274 family protein [Mycoplasma sp. Ms02]|uniref:MHJ_0274 family protein n=1 Tax=Mycoplasma sp. Ms02 TaxID=353851 RepID=UPI001C8AF723|nr:hypothetical protein [Mycoplasma sp. Ms02]QZE12180.1 hypothetical protein K4L35_02445 [Mycoplasma sp. Ms02]
MEKTTLILFGIIILGLVLFFSYFIVSDRIAKRKLKREKKEFEEKAKEAIKTYVLKFQEIYNENEKDLKNFRVSVGEKTMSEINLGTRDKIDAMFEEKDFKAYILNNEDHQEWVLALGELRNTKSNNWDKKSQDQLQVIRNKAKWLQS